jgi:hypothetical protein
MTMTGEAVWEVDVMRRVARPYAPTGAMASGAAASRIVREDAAPVLLYGWDDEAGEEVVFGYVGGPVGMMAGNASKA